MSTIYGNFFRYFNYLVQASVYRSPRYKLLNETGHLQFWSCCYHLSTVLGFRPGLLTFKTDRFELEVETGAEVNMCAVWVWK